MIAAPVGIHGTSIGGMWATRSAALCGANVGNLRRRISAMKKPDSFEKMVAKEY